MLDLLASFQHAPVAPPSPPVRPAPTALVLFVGQGCCPGPEEFNSLGQEGLRCLWAATPEQALKAAQSVRFDAVVLDARALSAPHGKALADLRSTFVCPLIVVAERSNEIDEIVALELGADAYLHRPVAPRRLRAHLGVLLRQRLVPPESSAPMSSAEPRDDASRWWLDRGANRLIGEHAQLRLTELQSALMQCLLEAQGRVVARAQLAAVLPLGRDVHARSVDVYVHRLRKRLADAGVLSLTIESARGRGYALRVAPRNSAAPLRAVA